MQAPRQSKSIGLSDLHLSTGDTQNEGSCLDVDDNLVLQEDDQPPTSGELFITSMQPNHEISLTQPETILQDILGDTLNFAPIVHYSWFEQDPLLEDMDFSFLNDTGPPELPALLPISPLSNSTSQQSTIAIGAEAYKGLTALAAWNPGGGDNYKLEQQDLIISQSLRPSTHSALLSDNRAFLKKDLSPSMRDQILAMVLRTTSRAASSRVAASFPSVEILRDLIHHAF